LIVWTPTIQTDIGMKLFSNEVFERNHEKKINF